MKVIYHERIPMIFTTNGAEASVDRAMHFNTAEMFETVVKACKAIEGLHQRLVRLEEHLSVLRGRRPLQLRQSYRNENNYMELQYGFQEKSRHAVEI